MAPGTSGGPPPSVGGAAPAAPPTSGWKSSAVCRENRVVASSPGSEGWLVNSGCLPVVCSGAGGPPGAGCDLGTEYGTGVCRWGRSESGGGSLRPSRRSTAARAATASGTRPASSSAAITGAMTAASTSRRSMEPAPPERAVKAGRPSSRSAATAARAASVEAPTVTRIVRTTAASSSRPPGGRSDRRSSTCPSSAPATKPSPLAAPRYPATSSGLSVRCGATSEAMILTVVIAMTMRIGVQGCSRA